MSVGKNLPYPTYEDLAEMQVVVFEWADSYDTKDWTRLASILAPRLDVDYSEVMGFRKVDMSGADFTAMMSDKTLLGDPLVVTQHFIGAGKYQMSSETSCTASFQIRAAHQRYTCAAKTHVEAAAHGHGVMQHKYVKTCSGWKLAGVRPTLYWNEHDFGKIFPSAATNH